MGLVKSQPPIKEAEIFEEFLYNTCMSPAEFPQHFEFIPSPEAQRKPNLVFGVYLPETILTNLELESWNIRSKERAKPKTARSFLEVTGIETRRVANDKETPLAMGLSAAKQALNGKRPDAVIVSTSFPVGFNVSQAISEELGLSPRLNMDVHAACSGFTRSLFFLKEKEEEYDLNGKRVIIVATEKYSSHVHNLRTEGVGADPSLAQTLFSDGAYAMTFEYGRDLQVLSALNHRFPKEVKSYIQMPVDAKLMIHPFIEEFVPYPKSGRFEQNGKMVLDTVSGSIWSLIDEAVQKANLTPSDIKRVFPHQGSKPMTQAIINGTMDGYADGIVYEDFEEGNFSSASIPKALMKAVNQGEIKRGDILVLAGFGAGMFASITVVRLN